MSGRAWDCIGARDVEIGARRWTVEWWVWIDGHSGLNPDCADHYLENCSEGRSRHFPNRGLAVAFAKRHEEARFMTYPRVCEEVFEDDTGTGYGWWERVGEYEEIDR